MPAKYTTHCIKGHELAVVGTDGPRNRCAECRRAWCRDHKTWKRAGKWKKKHPERNAAHSRDWYRRHPHYERAFLLKKKYDITLEEYNAMLVAQNGVCAICGKPETHKHYTGVALSLAVDHDHQTGKVRGLLCKGCNGGLGNFEDDDARLEMAMKYLRKARV